MLPSPDLFVPAALRLDISGMARGIDNYHVDVLLSPQFCADLKQAATELLRQLTTPDTSHSSQAEKARERVLAPLRQSYLDMMTVLTHRHKTNLSAEAVNLLPFAVLRKVLHLNSSLLKDYINQQKHRAAELRHQGSGELLRVHQHVAWLSRHFSDLLQRLNQPVLEQLSRVEQRQLFALRRQTLGAEALDLGQLLANPLLTCGRDLGTPSFLLDHYFWWGGKADDPAFADLNDALEELLTELFPDLPILPLRPPPVEPPVPSEVYDDLGGLHALRPFLGLAEDCKDLPHETFCWLEHPPNLEALFNLERLTQEAAEVRQQDGLRAGWRAGQRLREKRRKLDRVARLLERGELLRLLLASYKAAQLRARSLARGADARVLCLVLADQVPRSRLQEPAFGGGVLNAAEEQAVEQARQEVKREARTRRLETAIRVLVDWARFRLHLKQLRFAHRLFNRVSVLESPEHVKLSRQAGTLHYLPMSQEVEDGEARIQRHTVLKADIRGSMRMTMQLEEKGLNPASHFSLRFFEPINELLPQYGADKVFIEGDAIILSFLEYENRPEDWLSVARACGLARSLLAVLHANNREIARIGLPPLEIGIGICHADEGPRFLFDGERPIMISSAIGQADRLSSSSWRLRDLVDPSPFQVEVLEIAESEREQGEKGQDVLRFNIDGILLDEPAFAKLSQELNLRRFVLLIEGNAVVLYSGEYQDREGKKRSLVIREGRTSRWETGKVLPPGADSRPFYEVVGNPRVLSLVQAGLSAESTLPLG